MCSRAREVAHVVVLSVAPRPSKRAMLMTARTITLHLAFADVADHEAPALAESLAQHHTAPPASRLDARRRAITVRAASGVSAPMS